MRTRDMPATPCSRDPHLIWDGEKLGPVMGLTKREAAAIAYGAAWRTEHLDDHTEIARLAVKDADALFDALDEEDQ